MRMNCLRPVYRYLVTGVSAICISSANVAAQNPPPDGYTLQVVGLSGELRETLPPFYFQPEAVLNAGGQVAGTAYRGRKGADGLGTDAWFFDGRTTQLIGLTGADYEIIQAGKLARGGGAFTINNAGQVVGITTRVDAGQR